MKKCKHVVVKGVHKASGEKSVLGYIVPANSGEFFSDVEKVDVEVEKHLERPFNSPLRDTYVVRLVSTLGDPYGTTHVCIGDYSSVSTEFVYEAPQDIMKERMSKLSKQDRDFIDDYMKERGKRWREKYTKPE